jgi:phage terminase large subunit
MKTIKEIQVLKHFYQLENSNKRYVIFRGGTRSGKTFGIIQNLLSKIDNNKNITIIIGVETLKQSKSSLLNFIDFWIVEMNLLNKIKINRSDFTYQHVNGSIIRVLPCDRDTKWFGVVADIFWFNEAQHIDFNIFEQAQMRLPDRKDFKNQIILDFNPTNPHCWVRDLEQHPDAEVFISTYKDNPFLGNKQIELYEDFKTSNYNKWLVYGCGEYGDVRGAIYTNWTTVDKFPDNIKYWYGMDFGFTNDPTTLIKVGLQNGEVFVDEIIYERGLTNQDICSSLKELGITRLDEIIADSAEPKSIEEIRREQFRISGVQKLKGSIVQGIDILQRYKINITKRSKNIQDEIINYTWVEDRRKGEFINRPVSDGDHALDAIRYVALSKLDNKPQGPGIRFVSI